MEENEYAPYDSEDQAYDAFEEFLNDMYPTVSVAGLVFDPAEVIKEMDPVAHRTMFVDWLDAEQRNA